MLRGARRLHSRFPHSRQLLLRDSPPLTLRALGHVAPLPAGSILAAFPPTRGGPHAAFSLGSRLASRSQRGPPVYVARPTRSIDSFSPALSPSPLGL
jgi:hypothetical protein